MNIYIHVENVVRELDSKILLAILAASRGHQVIVSNLSSITRGVALRLLAPGIFHTKSLTPGEDKILRHQKLIDSGFNVTSIDEEGGLVDYGYDKFAKIRYSEKTIDQSTAVFGWGVEDTDSLKKIFSKYSSKIYKTGSPRADLWKPLFYNYWDIPKEKPSKPYLLISSNLGIVNNKKSVWKLMEQHKNSGYYKRDPELIYKHLVWVADESRMMSCFIEAIKYLSKNNNLYDIVLRPHPTENEDMWKIFLDGIPNVHVIQKGPITNWVVHSFAVLHNGCTTSIEASISGKPVISYVPFKQKYSRQFANDLGCFVATKEDLLKKINSIYLETQTGNLNNNKISEKILNKIYLDDSELAADKIIKVWEGHDNKNFSKVSNWLVFKFFLKIMKLRDLIKMNLLNFFSKNSFEKNNNKFQPLTEVDICKRIKKIKAILKIEIELDCRLLSDKTILIKKK